MNNWGILPWSHTYSHVNVYTYMATSSNNDTHHNHKQYCYSSFFFYLLFFRFTLSSDFFSSKWRVYIMYCCSRQFFKILLSPYMYLLNIYTKTRQPSPDLGCVFVYFCVVSSSSRFFCTTHHVSSSDIPRPGNCIGVSVAFSCIFVMHQKSKSF